MLAPPVFEFDVRSGSGLEVRAGGLPLVRGSWFQYYAPDWSKGYYSSNYNAQKVERVDGDTVRVTFRSADGRAEGEQTFRREGDRLRATYRFVWNGDEPAKVEATVGMPWAPAFPTATKFDGADGRAPTPRTYPAKGIEERRFGPDASKIGFSGPAASVSVESTRPLTLFDGRGYDQGWADDRPLFWLGDLGIPVAKGQPAEFEVVWRFDARGATATPPRVLSKMAVRRDLAARRAAPVRLPLVPKPDKAQLDWEKPLEITGAWSLPAGRFRHFDALKAAFARRFSDLPAGPATPVDGGIRKVGLRPGGYQIIVRRDGVSVFGQDEAGLRFGVERLARLAWAERGRLWLPTGTIIDQPKLGFRGVHLFVGPRAVAFQERLWRRALLPLGMNSVVLQCERTAWNALPGTATDITMSREGLRDLFAMYRGLGVEPIPMIQSWGHAEWVFANGKNLDLAYNPEVPYAFDPRKPRAREVLNALWDEADGLLKPNRIHFGLDEVDMRGGPEDPAALTELWKVHLPFLGTISDRLKKPFLMWGDQMLGPGEAVDAGFGDTKADAAARRAAVPKGATITDWHYIAEPKPAPYARSLDAFRNDGLNTIASPWYQPNNIRGFALAAIAGRCEGLLQTTWAGYESWEGSLLRDANQYAAMVLAADYAWSGRTEMPDKLGYDPLVELRRAYFGSPQPVRPRAGGYLGSTVAGVAYGDSDVRFAPLAGGAILLGSALNGAAPAVVTIPFEGQGARLSLLVDCEVRADDGEPVADVEVRTAAGKTIRGTIAYGLDVRAGEDARATFRTPGAGGLAVWSLDVPRGAPLRSIRIVPRSTYAGLRVSGITLTD